MEAKEVRGFKGKYSFLSNFYKNAEFELDGYVWLTVEHYYQAHKCVDLDDFHKIRNAKTPENTKKLGKTVDIRLDWNTVRFNIMKRGVEAKFSQNDELKRKLLDTGDAYLEETNVWGDTYWGVCEGKGSNKLGEILMDLRTKFRMEENFGF